MEYLTWVYPLWLACSGWRSPFLLGCALRTARVSLVFPTPAALGSHLQQLGELRQLPSPFLWHGVSRYVRCQSHRQLHHSSLLVSDFCHLPVFIPIPVHGLGGCPGLLVGLLSLCEHVRRGQ